MEKYTVQAGDSLWKISRNFNIDICKLASINGLDTKAEQHIIHPGQVLNLPTKDKFYDTQLDLKICDLVWRPLKNAKVRLTFDSKMHDYITDGTGSVAGLLIEDSTKGIKVELQHLNQKDYIVIANHKKLPLGKKILRISSREMIVKGSTSAEKGTQQSSKQQEKERANQGSKESSKNGTDKKTKKQSQPQINKTTRTEGGTPTSVSNIGNVTEGLRLPPEAEQYREYIIDTAKKYGFQPEGIAALIYAESRWKANATNSVGSGAVGLGQFKPNTWLYLCSLSESKVYTFLTNNYSYQTVLHKNGELWGVLINGKEVKIDNNTVLSLRLNAEYNIDMIGLYDRSGIAQLSKNLPSVDSLEPDELVKIAYLIHMNGSSGAYDIIMNGKESLQNKYERDHNPTESTYKARLQSNLKNAEKEKRYLSIDKTYRTAFVAWMVNYYDSLIEPDHYRVTPKEKKSSTKNIIHKLNADYNPNTILPPVETTNQQASASASASASEQWHNPLAICQIRTAGMISSRSASFGPNVRLNAAGKPIPHQGVDIKAEPETAIYAVADGQIQFIVRNPSSADSYGKTLCIVVDINDLPMDKRNLCKYKGDALNKIYFFYAHLSEINMELSESSKVKAGSVLGKTGHSGNAESMTTVARGAHLHFEVRTKWNTSKGCDFHLDPSPFIDGFNYP